jgi:pilus assembly protein CpaC
MTLKSGLRVALLATTLSIIPAPNAPAALAQSGAVFQGTEGGIAIGVGKGTLIRLPRAITDVFISNNKVADVQVKSPTELYVFGISGGETSLYATDRNGRTVYSAAVRVAQNIDQIKSMLNLTMPATAIEVTPLNGMVLLTGTVSSPSEVEEATRLTQAFVGGGTQVVSKLKTATPVQVNLQVRFAEVKRDALKRAGVSFEATDGGFEIGRAIDSARITSDFGAANLNVIGRMFGLNIDALISAFEQDGLLTILAEPNLTALSGQTASFLAGGEFPIPINTGNGAVAVEFKQYGIQLSFSPTVLDGNRIAMRVAPEVSELDFASGVQINGFDVPGLTSRRADTMIELGSGQSFVIAGLLSNRVSSRNDRTPLFGNLPVLGALFRSDSFRRNETELVIVITPHLVKPISASKVHLPTDGFSAPTDAERWLLGRTYGRPTGAPAARPQVKATPVAEAPAPGFSLN